MLGEVRALLLVFPEVPLWTASIVHSGISSGASSHHLLQTNPDLVEVMTAGSPAAIKGFRPFTEEEFSFQAWKQRRAKPGAFFFHLEEFIQIRKSVFGGGWLNFQREQSELWCTPALHLMPVHKHNLHTGCSPKSAPCNYFHFLAMKMKSKVCCSRSCPQFTWSLMHLKNWTSRTCLLRRLRLILRLPVAIILMFYAFKPHWFFPVMRRAKGRLIVKKSTRKWHHHWIYE